MSGKSLYKLAGLLIVALATMYFMRYVFHYGGEMLALKWDYASCLFFFVAIGLSSLTVFLGGCAWYLLLRPSDRTAKLGMVLMIFSIAQFAKYVPGNVAHHIGRVALASAYGFKMPLVVFTMALEAAWVVIAATTLALVSLLLGEQTVFKDMPAVPGALQLTLALAGAAMIPAFGYGALNRWFPGLVRRLAGIERIPLPGLRVVITCLLLYATNLILMGGIMDILSRSLFSVQESHFWTLSGVFAVAWTAGFLAPGAPAGLGVREAILVAVLGLMFGPTVATGLAVLLRAVTVIADGLTFCICLVAKKMFFPLPTATVRD